MESFKRFMTEGGLTTKELKKTFKTSGDLRVTAFADKFWSGDKFETKSGKKVKLKKIEFGEWEYYANVPADKKLFLKRFAEDEASSLQIVDPAMKLRDLEKTAEFGGQSGSGKTHTI